MQHIQGDEKREAIYALGGYVYQIYQSASAWLDLEPDEFLYLEVAEDYAVAASDALNAVQVKATANKITINSDDIIASINSFVELQQNNSQIKVFLRHLTTSKIAKEKDSKLRVSGQPSLEAWRKLSRTGDITPLRQVLYASKLSENTKLYIRSLDDDKLREDLLKRIHFDCGAPDTALLERYLRSKLTRLLLERQGVHSQVEACFNKILITLLNKATQKENRVVDTAELEQLLHDATQISISRAQMEEQQRLITRALSSSSTSSQLQPTRLISPRPIDEIPVPPSIAKRAHIQNSIITSLENYGVAWIHGIAGVGKSLGAVLAAKETGRYWSQINLRGLPASQVEQIIVNVLDKLGQHDIQGLIVDDLECKLETYVIDRLLCLYASCNSTDKLLIFISPRPASSEFLFTANLPGDVIQKFEEFTEQEIQEILSGFGVNSLNWAKYIYILSGRGHPQLAIAAIHSMQNKNWNTDEFGTFDAVLSEDTEIERVRSDSRERLLNELSSSERKLLERISLKPGSFRRSLVLDLAQLSPSVQDSGIVFDRLIGTWIDELGKDQYALSPLLSNYAVKTLTDSQRTEIQYQIANSLSKGNSFDPIDADSALLAAVLGKNKEVIAKVCIAIHTSNTDELVKIAPHFIYLTYISTEKYAYTDDPFTSLMIRGAQLLIITQQESSKQKINDVLERFIFEGNQIQNPEIKSLFLLAIYGKLLMSEAKIGAIPRFWNLIQKWDDIIHSENNMPLDIQSALPKEIDDVSTLSIAFFNQARQLKKITELISVFEFLDSREELRKSVLAGLIHPDFDADTLLSGSWLAEHDAKTIAPDKHSEIYTRLEAFSRSWGQSDLAVCCRKFRAIILDEYGHNKDHALQVLDEGLKVYGNTNSELVRAKARVLYRAEDHQSSLMLSRTLIEKDAPLSKTEKAFLGRDAAISAETQGDYQTARNYYLYAKNAANECEISEMSPMRIGLMADAALASWHMGDREKCLLDYVNVLKELPKINPKKSLRAAHCHAVCRHLLLWMKQSLTGKPLLTYEGDQTKIYPGITSNPEPHPDIKKQPLSPIDLAWYMLAEIENICCLDVGISSNLLNLLPNGSAIEGEILLASSKMFKAFHKVDEVLFHESLSTTINQLAFYNRIKDFKLDPFKVTYGDIPQATPQEQETYSNFTEQLIICFLSKCVFTENLNAISRYLEILENNPGYKVREEFLKPLMSETSSIDFNTSTAALLFQYINFLSSKRPMLPRQIFELTYKLVETANTSNMLCKISSVTLDWIKGRWNFIWEHQRFLLNSPRLYFDSINQTYDTEDDSDEVMLISFLLSILPTMGFTNEYEIQQRLISIKNAL